MNPALIIIVVLVCFALWISSSGAYKLIGRFFGGIGKDAIDTMKEIDEEENDECKEKD